MAPEHARGARAQPGPLDEATRLHTRGNVYGLEDFKAGRCRLHRVEVEEVGEGRGKRLLHLQCHFGLDTLSWARRGARVTGVEFSTEAIATARQVARESWARFHDPEGTCWPPGVDYADPTTQHEVGAHEWQHSLSDIIGAGLRLDGLHEFPFCAWNVVAGCEFVERFSSSHAYHALPPAQIQLPLMFSLRASRPALPRETARAEASSC